MKTIQELAAHYYKMFDTKRKRSNGDNYICIADKYDKDETLSQLIYDAHNGMLPNDFKYIFIHEALNAISECTAIDTDDIRDEIYENYYAEENNFTLCRWLGSNMLRAGYVEDAGEETGLDLKGSGLFALLGLGYNREREEVMSSVLNSLK